MQKISVYNRKIFAQYTNLSYRVIINFIKCSCAIDTFISTVVAVALALPVDFLLLPIRVFPLLVGDADRAEDVREEVRDVNRFLKRVSTVNRATWLGPMLPLKLTQEFTCFKDERRVIPRRVIGECVTLGNR